MLKIWGRTNSINVQKAMWAIGELGLAHQRIDAGGVFGGLDDEAYLARNPNGKIPTLDDDGTVVWESNAIVRYLAGRYGAGGLWPNDPAARARADQWMEWQVSTLYPAFGTAFWGLVRTAPSQRDKAAIELAVKHSGWLFELIDEQLEGREYLAGETFTMGEIPVGATLYRYFTLEIERPELPNVEAWYARLQEREAYRTHVMVSYEDLRVTEG